MRSWIVVAAVTLSVALGVAGEGAADWRAPEGVSVEGLSEGWYTVIDTSRGRILAKLLPEQAPHATARFAALASGRMEWTDPVTGETGKGHYYDGIKVHLASAGQRFETGDRTGTGRGAPQLWIPLEGTGPVDFSGAGRLGMTRSSGGRVSGVQFFVSAASLPWLNAQHPCFGIVLEGREVAFDIAGVKTYENGRPIDDVLIERVRVFAVGSPAPLPEPQPYTPPRVEFELRRNRQDRR